MQAVPLSAPIFDENLILGEIPKPKKDKKQIVKKESSIIVCSCGKILKKSNKCKQCFDSTYDLFDKESIKSLEIQAEKINSLLSKLKSSWISGR